MKNILYLLLINLLFITIPVSCDAPDQTSNTNASLEASIDAMIPKEITNETPGLVVGVVQDGELIFSKGYGQANLAYGIANDPEMVYNIGSVAKQFLGYAFAMLHVDGALNIDDPVSDYLDNWPVFKHPVTLRHLLTHTSGYREAYTPSLLAGRPIGVDRLSREECLNVVRKQPALEFVPGSRYTYNSTAWVILAEVMEKVTGEDADTWVETNILKPLEMNTTQIESYVGEVIDNAAESYSGSDGNYTNEKSNRAIFGAADIFASVVDLAKWVNNYESTELGGEEVNNLFFDPFILNNGTNSRYALGIGVNTHRGLKIYAHTGGHEGFATQVRYYPEHDVGIITISNYGGTGWIPSQSIAELVLEEYMSDPAELDVAPVTIASEILEQHTGQYLASTGNRIVNLSMSGDSLMFQRNNWLVPIASNEFRIKGSEQQFTFTSDKSFSIANSNGTIEFHKIENWVPEVADLQAYEGVYWSDELETQYIAQVVDSQLVLKHRWNGEIPINPIAHDFFQAANGAYVAFVRNDSGNLTGFGVNSGRTLNMMFNRIE